MAPGLGQCAQLLGQRHTLGRWLDDKGAGGTFDVQRRAEEVPVADYVALAQQLRTLA